jgi:hypothetical protein
MTMTGDSPVVEQHSRSWRVFPRRSAIFIWGRSLVPCCFHWCSLHGVIYLHRRLIRLSSSWLVLMVSPSHLFCISLLHCSTTILPSIQVTFCWSKILWKEVIQGRYAQRILLASFLFGCAW